MADAQDRIGIALGFVETTAGHHFIILRNCLQTGRPSPSLPLVTCAVDEQALPLAVAICSVVGTVAFLMDNGQYHVLLLEDM